MNGTYIGYEGPCYRCEGKGWQSDADKRRCWTYDRFYRKVSL